MSLFRMKKSRYRLSLDEEKNDEEFRVIEIDPVSCFDISLGANGISLFVFRTFASLEE